MSNGTNDSVILTVLKMLALVVSVLGMIGFGLCGLWGAVIGVGQLFSGPAEAALFAVPGVVGLMIAFACLLATKGLLRSLGRNRS